jgi:hypothetical protein
LHRSRIAASAATALLALSACAHLPYYVEPALPAAQLATIRLDSRSKLLTLDGMGPTDPGDGPRSEIRILPGCRTLTAKYEESYFIWGEAKAEREGMGNGLLTGAVNSESHDYETLKPIRFSFVARAGYTYWVTASFTGDQFLPRLVELEPGGEASRKFGPEEPCGSPSPSP